MHTNHDLWDNHRYMGSSHTPNLVGIGPAIPELYLIGPFYTFTRHALHARQIPKLVQSGCSHFYRMVRSEIENCVKLRCIVPEIKAFQKRHWPAGRLAAHTNICPFFKERNSLCASRSARNQCHLSPARAICTLDHLFTRRLGDLI